ncbi:MAG: transporter, partial [Vicinamibacterales bacterium]
EYSLARRVALATDLFYSRSSSTRVVGVDTPLSSAAAAVFVRDSGVSGGFGVAPAVELSLTRTLGVLLGVRLIPDGARTVRSVTPAIAINFVH